MSLPAGPSISRSPFAGAAPLAHRPLNAIAATAGGGVPEARIKRLLGELFAPLQALHDRGRICGDITTASVGLDENGRAHLMAVDTQPRQSEGAAPTTAAGFAPYEFYLQSAQWPRGPWSDIYSLSAVAHSLVTGDLPPPAMERIEHDGYLPLAQRGLKRYDADFLRAIDAGLALRPADRPQSVSDFADSLAFAPAVDNTELATIPPIELHTPMPRAEYVPVHPATSYTRRILLAGVLLLAAAGVGVYWWERLSSTASPVIAGSQLVHIAQAPAPKPQPVETVEPPPAPAAAPQPPAAPAASEQAEPPTATASPGELLQPPSAAVARVAVAVHIQPWGEVWVNGVNRGISPPLRELKLAPGKYRVVVRNADLPAYQTTLEVKAGRPAAIGHTFR
ncbi:membrane protein [Bordetella pseudohinzii]|uniref:Non-specific serine/threonine protein kinase n=2 Tax=Bordetella pseudohinzii TaxID=1331258 RepID=A0ABN4RXV7_9BORD|nr:membrane protein [Bordetella pseudohinzii]ANY18469.1 hypothetical protein BBN53_20620 [Bordetella pseudohinzii]KMM26256.1 membrane protein [Bordetella pseudohinzii]KXA75489.1 hypothetical protein AW877_19805 [Bordetella pseudohinzii]KXA75937.1 hypothetical protein AW878_19215 [Bordetella pseudohinzii]